MVYAYAYVCVHTQEISIVKTAVLSQQGRHWQSADRLSRTLIINRVEVSFRGSQPSSHKNNSDYETEHQYVIRETISVSCISLYQ